MTKRQLKQQKLDRANGIIAIGAGLTHLGIAIMMIILIGGIIVMVGAAL